MRVEECIRVVFDDSTESNEGEGENAGVEPVRADAEDRRSVESGKGLGFNTDRSHY